MEELKLMIDKEKFEINLLLYRFTKEIISFGLTSNEFITLLEKLPTLINQKSSFSTKKEGLLQFIKEDFSPKKEKKISLFIEENIYEKDHLILFKIALSLLRYKNLILEQSKLYSSDFKMNPDLHIMDFQYDQNLLSLPYYVRVAGALLVQLLFVEIDRNPNNYYTTIHRDLESVKGIEAEVILQIVFSESANQSIKSTAGSSYEGRFETMLKAQCIDYESKQHDSQVPSVEYDFILNVPRKHKKIGVSVKRTLRERYKQNHDTIDNIDVDAMILVTLGIDLNENKVENILSKEKHFIFVASDLYKQRKYFNQNDRVFALADLNEELLQKLVK